MKIYNNKQRGLIKMIIIIIIAVAILSWYGVDIKKFLTSEPVQKNFGYLWGLVKDVWSHYLASSAHKLWDLWLHYGWSPLLRVLDRGDQSSILTS